MAAVPPELVLLLVPELLNELLKSVLPCELLLAMPLALFTRLEGASGKFKLFLAAFDRGPLPVTDFPEDGFCIVYLLLNPGYLRGFASSATGLEGIPFGFEGGL